MRKHKRLSLVVAILASFYLLAATAVAQPTDQPPANILILVGPSTHPPGSHEVAAGGRLVAHCLEHSENVPGIKAEVITAWPDDRMKLQKFASVVFTGDRFPPEEMPDRDRIMADLATMMDHGCGLVCFHYATGLNEKHVRPDGDHPLLRWMGGYFATGNSPHHKSIARIFDAAAIEPTKADHPVLRGWKPFTVRDEPYINNYFGPNGPAANVTALATSQLPPEAPKTEVVAWAVSRADGGRGAGIVMPHFYKNWRNEDLRRLIMNAIVWSAHRDVPREGVQTPAPDLAQFKPAAIEPPAPASKNKKKQ